MSLDLLNLANTPETFAKVVRTAIVVGDFLIRNPHIHYLTDWRSFDGQTAVERAVQLVATAPGSSYETGRLAHPITFAAYARTVPAGVDPALLVNVERVVHLSLSCRNSFRWAWLPSPA